MKSIESGYDFYLPLLLEVVYMYIYLQDIINHLSSVSGEKVYLNKKNYCYYHSIFFNDDMDGCANYLITEFRIDLVRDKKLREKLRCSLKSGDMCLGYINLDSGDYVDMESFNKNRLDYILLPSYDDSSLFTGYLEYNNDTTLINSLGKEKSNISFEVKFHRLINDRGLYSDWIKYCQNEYKKTAVEWCEQNSIKYTRTAERDKKRTTQ